MSEVSDLDEDIEGLEYAWCRRCEDCDAPLIGQPLELTLCDSDLCFDCAAFHEEEGEDDEADDDVRAIYNMAEWLKVLRGQTT